MKSQSLQALGARLREDLAQHEQVDSGAEARARRQLLAHVAAAKAPRPRWHYGFGAACAAVATAAVLFLAVPGSRPEPLRFWIEERTGHVDEWVTARDAEQSLRFSDGSSVVAAPHTTTRVMQISSEGAHLTLERGHLDAHVVHRDVSRWQVAAGPFVVHVTGTRFRVSWDPQTEKLVVKVTEGKVEVTGDGRPKHELTAGSVLELSAGAQLQSALLPEPPKAAPSAEPSLEAAAPEAARDEDEVLGARKPVERKVDFRELSTAGHYREALAAVEHQGFARAWARATWSRGAPRRAWPGEPTERARRTWRPGGAFPAAPKQASRHFRWAAWRRTQGMQPMPRVGSSATSTSNRAVPWPAKQQGD